MASSNIQLAEHVWKQHASNINHGFVNTVVLDSVVENAIGSDGLELIAKRFQSVLDRNLFYERNTYQLSGI